MSPCWHRARATVPGGTNVWNAATIEPTTHDEGNKVTDLDILRGDQ